MANLGIYIQVPFCQTKCTYCNFHTGVVSPGRFAPYSAAVCQEIRNRHQFARSSGVLLPNNEAVIDTVYFGGGTPSLLEPQLFVDMLNSLRGSFPCDFQE